MFIRRHTITVELEQTTLRIAQTSESHPKTHPGASNRLSNLDRNATLCRVPVDTGLPSSGAGSLSPSSPAE